MRMPAVPVCLLLIGLATGVSAAAGQDSTSQGAGVLTGLAFGAAKITTVRSERAVSGVLAYQPRAWITFSTSPTFVRATDDTNGTRLTSSGLGDLPLSVAVERELPGAWSPDFAASLAITLPTGSTQCGLGSGETSVGLDLGAGVSPVDPLHLSVGASRGLSGLSSQSALTAPRATSLSMDASVDLAEGWTASLSMSGDFGQVDSTQALSRDLGFGTSHTLGKRLAVTLDGSAGLTTGSPKWALSLGIGTAYSGVSPVGPNAAFRRLKKTFVGSVSRGSGHGKIGGSKTGTTSC
ncbi:MAG: hypothetical protein AUH42_01790 [Gemmatimonadetes bacterium 13_1_40CM_70_11]|nr:MAG: hypothetical protein AUH42_01790 [Gemmatimonadetes bacterium 13_1_40CM_70_11]